MLIAYIRFQLIQYGYNFRGGLASKWVKILRGAIALLSVLPSGHITVFSSLDRALGRGPEPGAFGLGAWPRGPGPEPQGWGPGPHQGPGPGLHGPGPGPHGPGPGPRAIGLKTFHFMVQTLPTDFPPNAAAFRRDPSCRSL